MRGRSDGEVKDRTGRLDKLQTWLHSVCTDADSRTLGVIRRSSTAVPPTSKLSAKPFIKEKKWEKSCNEYVVQYSILSIGLPWFRQFPSLRVVAQPNTWAPQQRKERQQVILPPSCNLGLYNSRFTQYQNIVWWRTGLKRELLCYDANHTDLSFLPGNHRDIQITIAPFKQVCVPICHQEHMDSTIAAKYTLTNSNCTIDGQTDWLLDSEICIFWCRNSGEFSAACQNIKISK